MRSALSCATLCATLILAGCGSLGEGRVIVETIYERPEIAPDFFACAAAPKVPDAETATERSVAAYLVGLHFAHQDCRGALARLERLLAPPAGEP